MGVKTLDTRLGAGVELNDGGFTVEENVGIPVGVTILLIRVGGGVFASCEGWVVAGSFTGTPVGAFVGPDVGKLTGAFVQYSGVAST